MADKWTVPQLAQAAGVTDTRIRQLLLSGKLRGEKFGDVWAIDDKDAQEFLKSLPQARRGRPRSGDLKK